MTYRAVNSIILEVIFLCDTYDIYSYVYMRLYVYYTTDIVKMKKMDLWRQ